MRTSCLCSWFRAPLDVSPSHLQNFLRDSLCTQVSNTHQGMDTPLRARAPTPIKTSGPIVGKVKKIRSNIARMN